MLAPSQSRVLGMSSVKEEWRSLCLKIAVERDALKLAILFGKMNDIFPLYLEELQSEPDGPGSAMVQ